MNKKLFILMIIMSLTLLGKTGNAILKYVSPSDYVEIAEKFDGKKNMFKPKIYNKEVIVNEIALVESRLKMVFVNTLTAIQVGNQWSAVVYYNEPNLGQKRLVVSGQTSLKVDEYTYSLTPIKNGVTIKDVKSGNIYKLEVKGR